MLYLTCTTITSVDLAHYGVSHVKNWVSGDCGTNPHTKFQDATINLPLTKTLTLQMWPKSEVSDSEL